VNGAFLILSVLIGPGLIINAVFKDHWDRPRPGDVVEFGGMLQCTPAPLRGESGESFPCGHCSVGFLFASGWWLWKRRRSVPPGELPHIVVRLPRGNIRVTDTTQRRVVNSGSVQLDLRTAEGHVRQPDR